MQNDRERSLDLVKAFLIWLVVIGHLIQFVVYHGRNDLFSDKLFVSIYMFHMPLFMAVSGYFVKIQKMRGFSFRSIIKKRAAQLLVPMTIWVIMGMIVKLLLRTNYEDFTIFIFTKQTIQSMFDSYWFLWAIFISYCLIGVLVKLPSKFYISAIAISALLLLLPFGRIPAMGHTLSMFAQMFPFFVAGMLLGERRRAESETSMVPLLSLALIVAVGSSLFYSPAAVTFADGGGLWRTPGLVLTALLMRGAVSLLVAALLVWIYRSARSQVLEKVSRDYGTATLQIYLVQGFVFEILKFAVDRGFLAYASYGQRMAFSLLVSVLLLLVVRFVLSISRESPRVSMLVWGA